MQRNIMFFNIVTELKSTMELTSFGQLNLCNPGINFNLL